MTIHEIMTLPNSWQDAEVTVHYAFHTDTYILCSDENGFFLKGQNGVTIREFEELGDDVDRLQISIVY